MADEVATPEPVADPLQSVIDAHVKRTAQLMDDASAKTMAICDDNTVWIKERCGMRSGALDRALTALGIVQPKESVTQPGE